MRGGSGEGEITGESRKNANICETETRERALRECEDNRDGL